MVYKIFDDIQEHGCARLPVGYTYAGSACPVEIEALPEVFCSADVIGVAVTLVNADGRPITVPAERTTRGGWTVLVRGEFFERPGFVASGVRLTLELKRGIALYTVTLAVGDLEVTAVEPSAQPGDQPASAVQMKTLVEEGGVLYVATTVDEAGVQHYVRQAIVYDQEMDAWGAEWSGDYVRGEDGKMEAA